MRVIFTFDTYGTLIDWLGGVKETLKKLFNLEDETIDKFIQVWGEYDYRLVQSEYKPYREILMDGFKAALDRLEIPYTMEKLESLTLSIKEWPPFPDTTKNLLMLKKIGEIGIISNTDREFIQASISKMGVEFDHVVVAEDIKLYKPNPKVFHMASKIMGLDARSHWFHISSYHTYDIIPAKKSGLNIITVLLDRYGYAYQAGEYADYIFKSFDKLVDELGKMVSSKA